MKTKIIAKAVLAQPDGRILVMRRAKDDVISPGEWDFPGGSVEDGESFDEGAAREIEEEAGITIDPKSLQLIYTHTMFEDRNKIWLFYIGSTDQTEVTLSHEHEYYEWMDLQAAIDSSDNDLHRKLLQYLSDHQLLS